MAVPTQGVVATTRGGAPVQPIRILAAFLGLILGCFGFMSTAEAAIAASTPSYVHAHGYNGHPDRPEAAFTMTQRGPPNTDQSHATSDAIGRWSRGPLALSDEVASRATYDYDHRAPRVGSVQALVAAQKRVGQSRGDRLSLGQVGVAAKSERLLGKADRIEQHLARPDFEQVPQNAAMIARIRSAATEGATLSGADKAFMRHELTENWLMNRGVSVGPAHRMAGWTHRTYGNYDPSVIKQFPQYFSPGWKSHWGIE